MSYHQVRVTLPDAPLARGYSVVIGKGLLSAVTQFIDLERYTTIVVIVDRNVITPWLGKLLRVLPSPVGVVEVEPGEAGKDLHQVEQVLQKLKDARLDRRGLVLNLGGGMVGDLGGFAASIYMRGVDFVQIPTTLLAQVDASIGGKVGVNFHGVKNLLGAFNQPQGVLIDVETLSTLPRRELNSGFAGIFKHGLIRHPQYFMRCASLNFQELREEDLVEVIEGSCQIKSRIVEEDERESGVRKLLNFGHTLGHAFESLSLHTESPLLHGEAIAIGMVAEAWMSAAQGLISQQQLRTIERALDSAGLPLKLPYPIEEHAVAQQIQFDKKNAGGAVLWTLLTGIGDAVYDRHVSAEQVRAAIAYVSRS